MNQNSLFADNYTMRHVLWHRLFFIFLGPLILGACAQQPEDVTTGISFNFEAFSAAKRSAQNESIGDNGDFCYVVHVQGKGVGKSYKPDTAADCTEKDSPQGLGVISNVVGRKTSSGADPVIEVVVPSGEDRIFHLVRFFKEDIESVVGQSVSCFGSIRLGEADPIGGPGEIYFDPTGTIGEIDISMLNREVIGYAKTDIIAGRVATVSLEPVYYEGDSDNGLGVPYYGCGGVPTIPLEPQVHITMRPKIPTGVTGFASVSTAIRVEVAPPRWNRMTSRAAADDQVPENFIGYKVALSSSGVGPQCDEDSAISLFGRSEKSVTFTVDQDNLPIVGDSIYDVAVCAVYDDGVVSEGNLSFITALKDCTYYYGNLSTLNSNLSALGPNSSIVACLNDPPGVFIPIIKLRINSQV